MAELRKQQAARKKQQELRENELRKGTRKCVSVLLATLLPLTFVRDTKLLSFGAEEEEEEANIPEKRSMFRPDCESSLSES